ncbi:MAG: SDR family oxidoreductase [Methanothrix sp.]|nr:SDR family oxidoreductase [Methanothrix sp.]
MTGFLGRHILWDLLRRQDVDTTVYCLLRPDLREGAPQRLDRLMVAENGPLPDDARARCHAVTGDIVDERLTADAAVRERLLGEVDRIIHCAATVRFDHSLAEARTINVEGTRHVLRFAEELQARGRLRRFDYFSTAYVVGKRPGLVTEDQLEETEFNNTYEHTKWEAERLVHQYQQDMPIAIFRPSIIVGDSKTGYTSNFRVLYWPLRVLSSGLVVVVPADRKGIVDVVPIDYVCGAFELLSHSTDSLTKTYHLTAGPEGQSSIQELLQLGCQFFGVREPYMIPPEISYRIVRPLMYAVFWGKRRKLLKRGELYFPYFAHRASFDTSASRPVLAQAGIQIPSVSDYFRNIMTYCVDTDWGRKRPR